MTTPTREQVIEWAKAANILQSVDLLETNQWRHDFIRELTCLCTLAMSAGRGQGLREAKEVPKREFCEWQKLPTNALDVMKELGNFGPTVNAMQREVKGYMLDDEGDGVSRYWTSDDLRNIANVCNEVADWLDQRAAIEQLSGCDAVI